MSLKLPTASMSTGWANGSASSTRRMYTMSDAVAFMTGAKEPPQEAVAA
jgi:hypothetical protein